MTPVIVAGVFYLAVVALCLARPHAGRLFVGVFFWVMALGVHGYFIIANPQSYVDFAHSAYLALYRDLAGPLVELSPRGFGLLCLVFELAVGTLILGKGRAVRFGLLAGIAFLLAITPLGKEELINPLLAAGLASLLSQRYPRSLPELLRARLGSRPGTRAPAEI